MIKGYKYERERINSPNSVRLVKWIWKVARCKQVQRRRRFMPFHTTDGYCVRDTVAILSLKRSKLYSRNNSDLLRRYNGIYDDAIGTHARIDCTERESFLHAKIARWRRKHRERYSWRHFSKRKSDAVLPWFPSGNWETTLKDYEAPL